MSFHITISAAGFAETIALPLTEIHVLDRLPPQGLAALKLLFDIQQPGGSKVLKSHIFGEAVNDLLGLLEQCEDRLPYTYRVSYCFPGTNQVFTGSGMLGGLRIGDSEDVYSINCGFGFCDLDRLKINSKGRGELVERTDIRNITEFSTKNMGVIKIIRKRRPFRTIEILAQMLKLSAQLPRDCDVAITIG